MGREFYLFASIFISLQFFTMTANGQLPRSADIRPVRDNIGFCWNAEEMNHFIEFLTENNPEPHHASGNLVAAISSHDDYLYAGNVYYPLFKNIKSKEVIIFGVTHGTVTKEIGPLSNILILDEYSKWQGPYGDVELSPLRENIKSELPEDYFIVSNKAHSIEHSIEALIPFLQYYNRDIKITPVMVTRMPLERMEEISTKLSEIIAGYAKSNKLEIGKDIVFLISNDADHYGEDFNNSPYGMDADAHRLATEKDIMIIKNDLTGKITRDNIYRTANDLWPDSAKMNIPLWCGRYSIVFGLQTALNVVRNFHDDDMLGELLKYSDTFTEKILPVKNTSMGITAVFSYKHWCGWFSEGFYIGKHE
jgi:AmmeMemoRadiSam system protein B